MEEDKINGRTIEEIDAMVDKYVEMFGDMPLTIFPQSVYSPVYITLIERAIRKKTPYTYSDIEGEMGGFADKDI